VTGEDVEVTVERLDVDAGVGHCLGAVDQDGDVPCVSHLDHLSDRVDGAQRVGDVDHADDLGSLRQHFSVALELELARVGDRHDLELRPRHLAKQLPGDDVGVVLHARDQNLVAGTQPRSDKARGHQIDALGGAAGEDDLTAVGGAEVVLDGGPCALIRHRSPLREQVDASVNIGAVVLVEVADGVDHLLRLLGGGRVVEIDQRTAVRLLVEGREVRPDALDVESGPTRGCHR